MDEKIDVLFTVTKIEKDGKTSFKCTSTPEALKEYEIASVLLGLEQFKLTLLWGHLKKNMEG